MKKDTLELKNKISIYTIFLEQILKQVIRKEIEEHRLGLKLLIMM